LLDEPGAIAHGAVRVEEVQRSLLVSILGNSPFLGQCLLRERTTLSRVLTEGPDPVFNNLVSELSDLAGSEIEETSLMRLLRGAKRRAALIIALADIAGAWSLERVTGALSEFADHVVDAALRHRLQRARLAGDLPGDAGANGAEGVVVLGLGKLGARELNYSSDIDLIVLFDPERLRYSGRRSAQGLLVRIARDLCGCCRK
jgi:glutamate-ammonia-ligase adenylyltransferase